MYSANGAGCCLTYRWPGPARHCRSGRQTRLVFVTPSGGTCSTAPTSVGTPTASTAASITCGRVGVAQRVDVAGVLRPDHQVRLRRRRLLRRASASAWVPRAWLSSTARRSALNSRPGSRHVALHRGHLDRPAGLGGRARHPPSASRPAEQDGEQRTCAHQPRTTGRDAARAAAAGSPAPPADRRRRRRRPRPAAPRRARPARASVPRPARTPAAPTGTRRTGHRPRTAS